MLFQPHPIQIGGNSLFSWYLDPGLDQIHPIIQIILQIYILLLI